MNSVPPTAGSLPLQIRRAMTDQIKKNLELVRLPLFPLKEENALRLREFYKDEILSPPRSAGEVASDLAELFDLVPVEDGQPVSRELQFFITLIASRYLPEGKYDKAWILERNARSEGLYRSFEMPQAPEDLKRIFLLWNEKAGRLVSNNHQLSLLIDYLSGVEAEDDAQMSRYLLTVYYVNLLKVKWNDELLRHFSHTDRSGQTGA